MAVWHKRSQKKKTGGRTRRYRKSRKYDLGSQFAEPQVGEKSIEKRRMRGGDTKNAVKKANQINLAVDGEVKKVEIESVEDNPANPNFVRRSLLTKGAVIQTPEGKARITSRPGQDGMINGELVEE